MFMAQKMILAFSVLHHFREFTGTFYTSSQNELASKLRFKPRMKILPSLYGFWQAIFSFLSFQKIFKLFDHPVIFFRNKNIILFQNLG